MKYLILVCMMFSSLVFADEKCNSPDPMCDDFTSSSERNAEPLTKPHQVSLQQYGVEVSGSCPNCADQSTLEVPQSEKSKRQHKLSEIESTNSNGNKEDGRQ